MQFHITTTVEVHEWILQEQGHGRINLMLRSHDVVFALPFVRLKNYSFIPIHTNQIMAKNMYCNGALRTVAFSSKRAFSITSSKLGVWSDFGKRSPSLKIMNSSAGNDIFEGIDLEKGPTSLRHRVNKDKVYYAPELIDETFKSAYGFLEQESEKIYKKIDILNGYLKATKDEKSIQALKNKIENLSVLAEINNPEVMYNSEFFSDMVDQSHPVYRHNLKKKWESHDLMIIMQRLEQLHIIPDTMSSLEPTVEVRVKFGHNTDPELTDWISPGSILPAFAVAEPPCIKVQSFDKIEGHKLFTVLLVNPDLPDLETNSFKTVLQYGLANVALSNVDNVITPSKLLSDSSIIFKDYTPLLPEKNSGNQRACLWVFSQDKEIAIDEVNTDGFDIRSFAEKYNLTPVGAHAWRQHFDRSVNDLRAKFGLDKGRVFHRVRKADPLVNHHE